MPSVRISPTKGCVSSSIALNATGLLKSKKYRILFGATKVGEFQTSVQTTASKEKFIIPEVPTMGDKGELGSSFRVAVIAEGETAPAAEAEFNFRGRVILSHKKAAVGYKVKVIANGLLPEEVYFVTTVQGNNPDVAVAVLTTGIKGSGEAEFVIPTSLRPGKYQIQIKNRRLNYLAIQDAPTLEIQSY